MSSQGANPTGPQSQAVQSALKSLLDEPPKLHGFHGKPREDDPTEEDGLESWGIQNSFLDFIAATVSPDSCTLETGSGLSTVCFAIVGSTHICVSPFLEEHNRIRNYCRKHQISTEHIRFIQSYSFAGFPTIRPNPEMNSRERWLDFALIDGDHTFPHPMIDYFYVNEYLKIGGLLAVDDVNIPTVGILNKFLMTEPGYELVKFDSRKTGIFRKVCETPRIWQEQRLNSAYPDFSYLPPETPDRDRLRPIKRKVRALLRKLK